MTKTGPRMFSPEDPSPLSNYYRESDFFVVRSPLLPIACLLDWESTNPETGKRVETEGRSRLKTCLWRAYRDPALRDALFFASPEAHHALTNLRVADELTPKLTRTLLRYFLRATGRETPFGLLAGHSLGRVGDDDCFELADRSAYRSHTRISVAFLTRLMLNLADRPDVKDDVEHEPNPSLSLVHDHYRFTTDEAASPHGLTRYVSTVSQVLRTPELDRALELARGGRSLTAISRALLQPGVELAEVLEFCRKLSDARILVPTWLPVSTGTSTVQNTISQLERHPELRAVRSALADTSAELIEADSAEPAQRDEHYRRARRALLELESLGGAAQPLQTELVKPAPRLTISKELATRFLAAAELLQRSARAAPDPALIAFRERFVARYDRRIVPLVEALDGDLGIGFGGAEVHVSDGLVTDIPVSEKSEKASTFDRFDRLRLRLMERALVRSSQVVELDPGLLRNLPDTEARDSLPESFAVVARLARSAEGRLQVIAPELSSPSAVSLLGRFCETDPDLHAVVSRHARLEQLLAGETVLADVVYGPSDETANIVSRPVLRSYEIPCAGKSGAPIERQLPISDLLVGIEDGRVQLYSERLQKRVLIRIANAHNHDQASLPSLYRFLGALQHQGGSLVSAWSWGALEGSPFLPRVTSGDTVLSLARWEIEESEWRPTLSASPQELMLHVRKLRAARGLPRWLTRGEHDRKLTVDLENEISVEELVHEVRKLGRISLEELYPAHEQLVVHGPEGNYAGQFVVPFLRRTTTPEVPLPNALLEPAMRSPRRCRVPGSDWLYARIYAGRSRHAAIMKELRSQVIEPSLGMETALWFYLPFSDPEPHVRIRFQGSPATLRDVVLSRLERTLEPMLETGAVFRFELGSYEPELERYGGPIGAALAERLFFADSEAASQLVMLAENAYELRWQLALLGVDRLLADCGASLEQRAELARVASLEYGEEMGATIATWKAIGDKYRKHAPTLNQMLWEPHGADELRTKVHQILAARSARIRPIWSEIEQATQAGKMRPPDSEPLPLTFAHLHVLRVLGVGGREHELVLYEFLKRQYTAQLSRKDSHHALRMRSA